MEKRVETDMLMKYVKQKVNILLYKKFNCERRQPRKCSFISEFETVANLDIKILMKMREMNKK